MGNPKLRQRNYERQVVEAVRSRVVIQAVQSEYGLTDEDWNDTNQNKTARAVACYIAHRYYGASFSVCEAICNYNHVQTAHRAYIRVEKSPERKLMAKHILSKIKGVRVA